MIFRQFDLAIYFEEVDNILNDPNLYVTEIKVSCSEIGMTSLIITALDAKVPMERKRKRHFRRFLLHAGINEELIEILSDDNARVLNRHDFFTEQGAIVVLDYEVNKKE